MEGKWDLEEFGFGEDFLDFEEDKKDILYSEKKKMSKPDYGKVDFSKLDDLDFDTHRGGLLTKEEEKRMATIREDSSEGEFNLI